MVGATATQIADSIPVLALATGAGAGFRLWMRQWDERHRCAAWHSTLWCNLVGCAGMGVVLAASADDGGGGGGTTGAVVLLGGAAAGGFTTFSGACLDTVRLVKARVDGGASATAKFAAGSLLPATLLLGVAATLAWARMGVGAVSISSLLALGGCLFLAMRLGRREDRPVPGVEGLAQRASVPPVLLAVVGGAIGGAVRFSLAPLSEVLGIAAGAAGVLVTANLAGAALVGVIGALVRRPAGDAFWRAGVCGGLTTVSAFAALVAHDLQRGAAEEAVMFTALHLLAGPVLCAMTLAVATRWRGATTLRQ